MTRILLTGFEPFRHWTVNSSWEAVAHLAAHPGARGRGVEVARLPVDHGRAAAGIAALIGALRPEVVLLTGLADAPVPRLELYGRTGPLAPQGGPVLRRGRWPFAAAHAAVRARGLPIRLSDDAGSYVCDTTYWAALGTGVPRVGFLHLPPIGPVWTPRRAARVVEAVLDPALSR